MAQGRKPKEESVFRLVSADRAEQTELGSLSYRIVKGNARFLHNDTYLLCDSASWNVSARTIEAFGHVRVVQDETMLTSDEMLYLIDDAVVDECGYLLNRGCLVDGQLRGSRRCGEDEQHDGGKDGSLGSHDAVSFIG